MTVPRIAILTISDGVARGERNDASGDAIAAWASASAFDLVARETVADDAIAIASRLSSWCDAEIADVIVTTGGTGFTARDVTPEATRAILERDVPGIAEGIRARGTRSTPFAVLSRGVSGLRGRTLIVNLAGSAAAVADGLDVLSPLMAHTAQLLRGVDTGRHPAPDA